MHGHYPVGVVCCYNSNTVAGACNSDSRFVKTFKFAKTLPSVNLIINVSKELNNVLNTDTSFNFNDTYECYRTKRNAQFVVVLQLQSRGDGLAVLIKIKV